MLETSKIFSEKDINLFRKSDIKKLGELIIYHSDLYYNKDEPIISDTEYDELFKKLEFLEEKFNLKNKISQNIGAETMTESSFKKVKHTKPMISLDNTYNEEDLTKFDERVRKNIETKLESELEYVLEFKFDGLGVELIYINGKLNQAITRGNGIEGEDITENIMQIANVPKKIKYTKYLEVRGEVVMPISVFEELNNKAKQDGTKVFSNPRNAASGSVRMKNNLITKQRKLKFFAYDLANFNDFTEGLKLENYFDVIQNLEKLGFNISSYFIKYCGIEEIIEAIVNFGDIKKTIDFEIDGLVLKANNIKLWKEIGWTEHHPKYAIAYKFPAEILTTTILSVNHQVGKTGTITPVANLEALNIGGVIVRRATLHNYEEVENLDARVGDSVFIKRAGEVIPKIISIVKQDSIVRDKYQQILPPKQCPSCQSKVIKDESKVRYYCSNIINCPAQHSEKLTFAVGRNGFNIDGFGEKQVKLFLEKGIIKNISDIFKLDDKKEDILELEGFKEKSVENLLFGIQKAKNMSIATFITVLGISGVGKKTAKNIQELFLKKNNILNFNYTLEEIENLDDIGPEIAKNILEYFSNNSNKIILEKLLNNINLEYYKINTINNNLIYSGKKMCITGSFTSNDGKKISRDYLIKILEENGGDFIGSVSKNLDYLLAGEKAGSKLKKATKLGVEIITLETFLNH